MVTRVRIRDAAKATEGGSYYKAERPPQEFVPTGCRVLDCVIGKPGWPLGRIANIVGDESTGKTLLAIEAAANFATTFDKGQIYYRESEAAFDQDYAATLGLPLGRTDFGKKGQKFETVEDVFEDMEDKISLCKKKKTPTLYILDSLDALSSREEKKRKIDEGSYSLEKQKLMSQLFRRLSGDIEEARMAMIIISQVRHKIGVTFGEKRLRAGGKALDFYASFSLWLSHIETLKRKYKGVERAYGVRVRAKCKKNKIGPPFRECEFVINFGYGVDDLRASVEFLNDVGRLRDLTKWEAGRYLAACEKIDDPAEYRKECQEAGDIAERVWKEIDVGFMPPRRKYA